MTEPPNWSGERPRSAGSDGARGRGGPKQRGRIPRSAWPKIAERYRNGATLSAIARDYECTPGAIAYVVRKAAGGAEGSVTDENGKPLASEFGRDDEERQAFDSDGEDGLDLDHDDEDGDDDDVDDPPMTPPATAESARPPEAPARAPAAPASPAPQRQAEARREQLPDAYRPSPRPAAPVRAAEARAPEPARSPAPAREGRQTIGIGTRLSGAGSTTAAAPTAAPVAQGASADSAQEETDQRLEHASTACMDAYLAWRRADEDGIDSARQGLGESLHELRRVLARIEIEMAASRRDEQNMRPIPIPTHRANQRRF